MIGGIQTLPRLILIGPTVYGLCEKERPYLLFWGSLNCTEDDSIYFRAVKRNYFVGLVYQFEFFIIFNTTSTLLKVSLHYQTVEFSP